MADLQGLSRDDLIAIIVEPRAENVAIKRRLVKLEKDSSNFTGINAADGHVGYT